MSSNDRNPSVRTERRREMKDKEASQREMIDQQYIRIANLQKANYRLKYELYEAVSGGNIDYQC